MTKHQDTTMSQRHCPIKTTGNQAKASYTRDLNPAEATLPDKEKGKLTNYQVFLKHWVVGEVREGSADYCSNIRDQAY